MFSSLKFYLKVLCLLLCWFVSISTKTWAKSDSDSLLHVGYDSILSKGGRYLVLSSNWYMSVEKPEISIDGNAIPHDKSFTHLELIQEFNKPDWGKFAWLETSFYVDSSLAGVPLSLSYFNLQPVHIWINGRLILQAGKPSKEKNEEIPPLFLKAEMAGVTLREGKNTMLIELSAHNDNFLMLGYTAFKSGIMLRVYKQFDSSIRRKRALTFGGTALLLLMLLIVHAFLAYKSINKYHIYVTLCTLFTLVHNSLSLSDSFFDWNYSVLPFFNVSFPLSYLLSFYFYIFSVRTILKLKAHTAYYTSTLIVFAALSLYFSHTNANALFFTLGLATILFLIISIQSLFEAKKVSAQTRIGVLAGGLIVTVLGALLYLIVYVVFGVSIEILIYVSILLSYSGIPVSLTLYVIQSYSDLFETLEQKIQERTEELEASVRFKSDFLSNISHEFITPLTICKNVLHLSQANNKTDSVLQNDFLVIEDNLNRLHNMVKQLLELTQTDQRELKLNKETILALPLYKDVVDGFKPLLSTRNIQLKTNYRDSSVYIHADKNRIQIILNNLLSNAIKFTPVNGTIYVETEVQNNQWVFSVRDTGPGIPKGFEEIIFDRFHRINQNDSNYVGGAGIGLELSRTLARLHHGEVLADPNQKDGALFQFFLPIVQPDELYAQVAANADETAQMETQFRQPSSTKQGYHILLVDDNTAMQETVSRILKPLGLVRVAGNGAEAIQLLSQFTPDLIISDIMMPVMNGYEFVKKVSGNPQWNGIPILMLTAKIIGDEKTELLKIGIIDYITKPFNPEHLLLKVQNLLRFYEKRKKMELSLPANEISKDKDLHEQMAAYILENIQDANITIERLADRFLQSRRTLFRVIEAETGMTPAEFVREIRLKKSLEILQVRKNIHLDELAYSVGYKTSSGFKNAFIERFGYHPTKKE
ncbi:response regulator [bacterium]|nr:MAG: response regulator [bacterium]